MSQPAVKGGGDGTHCVLQKGEALVEGWVVEGGHAHDHVRVPVYVFGDAVYDNICAMLKGILNVRREESVVHDNFDVVLMCNRGYGTDIDKVESRV